MQIKFVIGTQDKGGLILPERLDILADEVTPENFEYFSKVVSEVLATDPMYSFPAERGKPISGFRIRGGKIVKTTESPILQVKFYGQFGSEIQSNPSLYLATQEGLNHLESYVYVLSDRLMADKQGKEIFKKPNFLAFTAKPSDGRKVLEAIAKGVTISPDVIHPYSAESVYRTLGLEPIRQ